MSDLEERIEKAQLDEREMEHLLLEYLPFIKKQAAAVRNSDLEYEDRLSLAMMVFVNCIRQYQKGRGGFLSFCGICIKNRLIDEGKKQFPQGVHILPIRQEDESYKNYEELVSIDAYDRQQERERLQDEIGRLESILKEYHISFSELTRICPKQDRSRKQCMELARTIVSDDKFREVFLTRHQLQQAELAKTCGVSPKTVEKHRKYIVTLVLLLTGDYPCIQAFLPQHEEVR